MEKGGGSRLLQMQARFQQKQLQERELKIASLYEAQQARALDKVRLSPSTTSASSSPAQPPVHPGKVRQMFEERRTKAGIDKSYPLQPIHNTERAKPRNPLPNGYPKVTSTRVTVDKKIAKSNVTSTHSMKKQIIQKSENIVNASGDLNHNHQLDLNPLKNSNKVNGDMFTPDEVDKAENNCLIEDESFPEALAPTPTPRSPEPKPEVKRPAQKNPVPKRAASPTKPRPQISTTAPARRGANENRVPDAGKPRPAMQRLTNSSPSSKSRSEASVNGPSATASGGEGPACAICGRHFAPDRLAKHQEICKKSHAKKRKPFDVLKHRLAGTEAEPFIGKLRKSTTQSSKPVKQLNSSWRQKHEEFIQAIRAAKQVQAHLKAGGKLSDLPPPPPSENPDYVQCPHCNRRFNQAAAERHIPKCANYQFNKPKTTKRR
ncbi:zinc finger C2HC domain-containing protein 1C [Battus philenor]|uniref:zinc finger C2HC domain-containing protein 1C n=1 Tax=Battus philenor TaxID=42288 RepID=UPI0035CF1CD3